MRILSVGGGPAGLYFSLLLKKSNPAAEVTVLERNRPGDTFGFGVVFSDATMGNLALADAESHEEITRAFAHWGDIEIHHAGSVLRSTGHGFAGLGRRHLLDILERRAIQLGVDLRFGTEVTDYSCFTDYDLVLGADGVNSAIRSHFADAFRPDVDLRPNRFVWLGTTFPFEAFTFLFKADSAGLWRVHAYRYAKGESTFIVECTEETWRRSGMDRATEAETVSYCEQLFAKELQGHRLQSNRSVWRQFPTVKNAHWHTGNLVLVGDAVHTAHFSIGSGTKLAIEDAIALHQAVTRAGDIAEALVSYEKERKPAVESTQRAAQISLEWFEHTERYVNLPPLQFAASLLTRSLRLSHANLQLRDPKFMETADRWYAAVAEEQSGVVLRGATPPMFTPFRVRDLVLKNRVVVSPMCQYSAIDGLIDDWHLVHLGSRAVGGAGLVIAEMTGVSEEARITPGCAGIYLPEHVEAWSRVVDFVHHHASAKVGIQLGHAGRKGATCIPWKGGDNAPLPEGAWRIFAPSEIPWSAAHQTPRAMDRSDMERTISDYLRAVRYAEEAGFDWIEVHAAHGYLLAEFLSPLTNRRTDEYGGSVENRARFPLEVISLVREAWPADKPLSVRISANDWTPDGISVEDVLAIARGMRDAGVDIIDVSSGQTVPEQRPRYGRLYQTPLSDLVRNVVGIPTITVGAVSTYEDVNSVLLAGRADLVALARGHLHDPYFARHAAVEQGHDADWPPQYSALQRYTPRPAK